MTGARVVLTSVESQEQAQQLASALLERRFAACVNIVGPIRSIYRWKGKVENEQEYLLLIKTSAERSADLAAALSELHPYELPERIELEIADGSSQYLSWVFQQVEREAQ